MKTDAVRTAPDGPYSENFTNGVLAAEGTVRNGRKHGHWRYYFKDGSLKAEGDYEALTGFWFWNRANGQRLQEGAFIDNQQDGPWTRWHENGQVLDTGSYAMGKKIGLWKTFNPDGSLKSEKTHKG